MRTVRLALLLVVGTTKLVTAADAEPADALATEYIRAAVAHLDDADFRQREAAADQLYELGMSAIFALRDAAENGSPEVSVRAFEVLQRLYRGDDEPTFEAVESALGQLKRVDNLAVAARAERAFDSGAETRQFRAIAQFERLGGIIHFADRNRERQSFGRPQIENIMLCRDWVGGDAGLQLLGRIEDIRNARTSLYIIRGVEVSEKAKGRLLAELPFMEIQYRGPARLGIKSSPIQRDDGCIINDVDPGSAAERAGLRKGDQVIEIDGQDVDSFNELIEIIEKKEPGDKVPILFRRGTETHEVVAELSPWPPANGAKPKNQDPKPTLVLPKGEPDRR